MIISLVIFMTWSVLAVIVYALIVIRSEVSRVDCLVSSISANLKELRRLFDRRTFGDNGYQYRYLLDELLRHGELPDWAITLIETMSEAIDFEATEAEGNGDTKALIELAEKIGNTRA